jgi:hypothetical protein
MSYRFADVAALENSQLIGSGQCVELVKHYARAPATLSWHAGGRVVDLIDIPIGTAIATFVHGKYPNHAHDNHAALYMGRQGGCIVVMDQWPQKAKVTSRPICSKGTYKNGAYVDPSNNADAFFVIESHAA